MTDHKPQGRLTPGGWNPWRSVLSPLRDPCPSTLLISASGSLSPHPHLRGPVVASRSVSDLAISQKFQILQEEYCWAFAPDHTRQRSRPTPLDLSPARPRGRDVPGHGACRNRGAGPSNAITHSVLLPSLSSFSSSALSTYGVPGPIPHLPALVQALSLQQYGGDLSLDIVSSIVWVYVCL